MVKICFQEIVVNIMIAIIKFIFQKIDYTYYEQDINHELIIFTLNFQLFTRLLL